MKNTIEITELANCLTIDVGKNTGIARWTGNFFPETETLTYRGVIKNNLEKYLCEMSRQFRSYLVTGYEYYFDSVQIEGVEVWQSSSKSMASATRGDLISVAYLVGLYYEIARRYAIQVCIKTAPQWKGQLSKEGTAARVKRINGLTYANEHITDAVAMGFARVEDIWLLKRCAYKCGR